MREEIIDIGKRTCHIITTDSEPQCVLVKPLCSFERRLLLHECALIEQEASKGFAMYTFEVEEAELWKDRVGELLAYIETSLIAAIKARYAHLPLVMGGYSLGGLFALWTTTKTPIFDAVAACSPSLWMQGWEEYYEAHPSKAKYIYMSLGKKEEKTNKMPFKLVGDICRR
ncbi:MAG: alpha/beta hydrolase-fold protein, partial [Bacteroidales bacterium]|nr:alpha/beta hydrolase-fold protein [Bacteroidales bacterium]